MHGDEHAGVTVADSIIHGKVSVEGINLWVIPTMNPDGNAAHTRQNAHEVDLNRNWPLPLAAPDRAVLLGHEAAVRARVAGGVQFLRR